MFAIKDCIQWAAPQHSSNKFGSAFGLHHCLHHDAAASGSSLTTYKFGNQIVTSLLLRFCKSLK